MFCSLRAVSRIPLKWVSQWQVSICKLISDFLSDSLHCVSYSQSQLQFCFSWPSPLTFSLHNKLSYFCFLKRIIFPWITRLSVDKSYWCISPIISGVGEYKWIMENIHKKSFKTSKIYSRSQMMKKWGIWSWFWKCFITLLLVI